MRCYWDEARETMAPGRRAAIVLERVQAQLAYAYESLPFYRRLYDAHGLRPGDVRSLADFAAKVPVVTKDMLREDQERHPPFGSYGAPAPDEIARVYGSSGTTGRPTLYAISKEDWERAREAQAMAVWAMGVRPGDLVRYLFPMSMFVGGWAILLGAERIGAAGFPAGAMDTRRHIDLMKQLRPAVLAATPSYLLHVAQVAREEGEDLRGLGVRLLIVGGEPGGSLDGPRQALQDAFGGAAVADTGNTSECFPTQMNSSCEAGAGVHVFEDEVFLEVVERDDPAAAVPDGERGATVYTTLWRRSQPMIRFWAGDETWLTREPCPCGRTYPRLSGGLVGRVDDMLVVRGVNVYPSAIDDALRRTEGVGAEYRIHVERNGVLVDRLRLEVERDPRWPGEPDALAAAVTAALRRAIGLGCEVTVVEPGTHERMLFKARRVVDGAVAV